MIEKLLVPDIGDFEEVEIIEILVKTGDTIEKNDPVITLDQTLTYVNTNVSPKVFFQTYTLQ